MSLRVLVMHVSTRCDQACAHCSIWKAKGSVAAEWGVAERLAILREASEMGARSVLFTGGEPLLCDHIEALARAARSLGMSVQIATNGLGLARASSWVGGVVDELYVSLEGPEAIHDAVRGARMFARLQASLEGVAALSPRPRLVARSAISQMNASALEATVGAARAAGFDAVSFLPVDVTSEGFGAEPSERATLWPDARKTADLKRAIEKLEDAGQLGAFVLEDAKKLRGLVDRFLGGADSGPAPACNAPEWSSVIEADGAVRPCFFQPVVGRAEAGLRAMRAGPQYAAALRVLGPSNSTCVACVCPKQSPAPRPNLLDRVSRAFRLAAPFLPARPWSAA